MFDYLTKLFAPCWCTTTFAVIGSLFVLRYGFAILSFFYLHFLRPATNWERYGSKADGSYALITGASEGIGKAFAEQLAAKGFNVIISARSEKVLFELAKEIEGKYKVKVQVVVADAFEVDSSVDKIVAAVAGKNIRVLVNNVGVSSKFLARLKDTTTADMDKMNLINVHFQTKLTKAIAEVMAKVEGRKIIMNLSSFSSLVPVPLLAVYGAGKSYFNHWTISLAPELASDRIEVVAFTPAFIATSMTGMRSKFDVPTADRFVRDALNKADAGVLVNPFWVHALMGAIIPRIPMSFLPGLMLSQNEAARKAQLRRAEKAEKAASEQKKDK